MPFIVRCHYRPGGADERLHIRDVHISYMIAHRGVIETGGAIVSDDGRSALGMFLILNVESAADVEACLALEPYTRARLFQSRTIERLDRFIPHDDPEFLHKMLVASRDVLKPQNASS
jgi:uncharacterized protein YciI